MTEEKKVGNGNETCPLLRPLRIPLYDRVRIRSKAYSVTAFSDHRRFNDGTPKRAFFDTNLMQGGSLGAPLEFDLAKFGIFPAGESREYAAVWEALVDADPVVQWFFGMSAWFIGKMSTMKRERPELPIPDSDDVPEEVRANLEAIRRGNAWPRVQDMADPIGVPRRIMSTESFHVRIDLPENHNVDIDVFVVMDGTLYTAL